MVLLKLLPVVLSLVILSAHFMRHGLSWLVLLCLVLIALLAVPRAWVARVVQAVLLLGALEWLRTLLVLVRGRLEAGEPLLRMAIILLAVALLTAASALVFRAGGVRQRYFGPR